MVDQTCCTDCEDPIITSLKSTATFVDSNGYYTINQDFSSAYASSLLTGIERDPLFNMINRYGEDNFYAGVSNINNTYVKLDWVKELLGDPGLSVVNARIEAGPFTPQEIAAFMADQSYSPTDLIGNSPDIITDLNNWYQSQNGGFSSSFLGGICSLMPNIFAAIGGFFSLLGQVGGLVQDITKFIDRIKNIEDEVKAFFEKLKVTALIEAFKEKITKMVEKTIEKVKNAIKNFNLEGIVNDIKTFVNENVIKGFHKLKEKALAFFSKENIERIKQQIKDAFDYGIGLFSNPSLEEIQFLISRFCALAAGIEGAINALKNPLDSWANRFAFSLDRITQASNINTQRAVVEGGRPTRTPESRQQEIEFNRERWLAAGARRRITDEDYRSLPDFEQLEEGNHSSRLYFDRTMTSWPRYDGADGWRNANLDLRVILMRVAQTFYNEFGQRLHINSPWRSVEHNNRVGGETGSYHLSGNAFDISWNGYPNNRSRFLEIAYSEGFTGHGIYGGFVHVDLGNRVFVPG